MNWDQVEGKWKEMIGKAQSQWGKLTNDDLDVIKGRSEIAPHRFTHKTFSRRKAFPVPMMTTAFRLMGCPPNGL